MSIFLLYFANFQTRFCVLSIILFYWIDSYPKCDKRRDKNDE